MVESRLAEERAKKTMIDAAHLAEELRAEQENCQEQEKNRKVLEVQVKEMQDRLEEVEQQTMRCGRKVVTKLELRIRELDEQFDQEQHRSVEAERALRSTNRKVKELTFSQEEDAKNHERMQELVDRLQSKVRAYKRQIEEAEEIAALNLAKYRKVQADLESSEERADINEQVKHVSKWLRTDIFCRCWQNTRQKFVEAQQGLTRNLGRPWQYWWKVF